MLKVGLTGGIGAGKSAVAQRLVQRGAILIDSDVLAREVVAAGTDGQAEVVAAFGQEILGADGELDRPALGAKIFGDPAARRHLETIIHPRVRAGAAEMLSSAAPDAIVVNDVPLLVETGIAATFHLVIVVEADTDRRIRRLVETRGMTEEQATARIAAQADDAVRRAAADVVITNNTGFDELDARIEDLWTTRLLPYEENVRLKRHAPHERALHVVPSDPTWPEQAERVIARIRHALGGEAEVSHIGSTAVPGLPAKDLLDLMLAVPTLDDADKAAEALARAGLPQREGEWFDNARGVPGKTWPKRLHGNADPGRSVNLHVRVTGSPGWRFALLMRDHLRADTAARDGYAAAKERWAAQHSDVESYADAKEPWFDAEADAAQSWAEATGWQAAG
ncbi:dephospho-CoA kinase [Actinoplanes friuliensis]|uniref:dephospho-CoA kinase n=1 Tax=Actinoplanes friuliensis TaxID=196914 RepID=UPI0005A0BF7D|nr:dephospho-CoA kinase [Actinoplanes friuliensis]